MGHETRSAPVGVLVCAGLAAALSACNGSSNGPNGSPSTAATTPVTSRATPTPVTSSVTPAPAPLPSPPPVAAVQTNSKFVMTANFVSNDVSVWNVAATVGTLTSSVAAPALTQSTATGPNAMPTALATDPSGTFLYVADSGTNALDVFTVDRTTGALGRPAAPAMPTIATGMIPYAVAVDPTGTFVYTANVGDNTVSAFLIQPGGSLAACPKPTAMVGASPEALVFDSTGKFIYVANASDGTLSVLSIDAAGSPTPVGTPVLTGNGPLAIATVTTGTSSYVYVANNLDSTVSVFVAGAAGALTAPATGATVPIPNGGIGASAIAVDPTNSYLYVVDGFEPQGAPKGPTNDIAAFSISATTGGLTPIGTTNVKAGLVPIAIVVNASGRVLYVSDAGANAVLTFGIDPQTGALVADGSTPAGNGPVSIWASN